MLIDRRKFIQGAAATVSLLPLSAESPAQPIEHSSSQTASGGADRNSIVFKIVGWDCWESKDRAENEVSIRISQSWRTAWR